LIQAVAQCDESDEAGCPCRHLQARFASFRHSTEYLTADHVNDRKAMMLLFT
jgi:hypothetical protein